MLLILLIVLVLCLGGGFWGSSNYGNYSYSPAGLILVIILVLWVFGYFH